MDHKTVDSDSDGAKTRQASVMERRARTPAVGSCRRCSLAGPLGVRKSMVCRRNVTSPLDFLVSTPFPVNNCGKLDLDSTLRSYHLLDLDSTS